MTTIEVRSEGSADRQFERIAPVYDRTRGTLDAETAAALARRLRERGALELLEVAVGTGRVARPLVDHGLRVTGLDASSAMLARAADKGLLRLVRGSAYRLPFRDRSFDGTLFAHVLHLLDRPEVALREAARVSRGAVAALLAAGGAPEGTTGGGLREDDLRRTLHELLRAEGVPIPPFTPPWQRERALLERFPPTERLPVSDRVVTLSADERIETLRLRGYRHLLDVPQAALDGALAELRARYGGRTITSRRVHVLALWAEPPGPEPTPSSSRDGATRAP